MQRNEKVRMIRIDIGLLLLSILFIFSGCQKKMSVQDYLNLGEKYLEEANYEEAVVAFSKVIELEPKAMEAYKGLADAYIKTGDMEKAQEVIQSGIAVYKELAESEQTEEFKSIYEELLKFQQEIEAQRSAQENFTTEEKDEESSEPESDSEDLKEERQITEAKEKYGAVLDSVITVMDSETPTLTHYFTEDFGNFVKRLEKPVIWQLEDGRYLGLYRGTDGDSYVYLGEMQDGIRSGYGVWYNERVHEGWITTDLFMGEWSGDYPNGSGVFNHIYKDNIREWQETKEGNFFDGYEDGTMRHSGSDDNDDAPSFWVYEFEVTAGVPNHLIEENGVWIAEMTTVEASDHSPRFIYKEGRLWGIPGAMKDVDLTNSYGN